jgi:hypothetical protein
MALNLRSLALFASSAYGTAPTKVNYYTYATADAAATVLASGYFNDARAKLRANDVINVMSVADGTGDFLVVRVASVPAAGAGDVTVGSDSDVQAQRAVVPTSDGLTTGLITANDRLVAATSANSAHILTLPAIADVSLGWTTKIFLGSTACKLNTPATSNTKINNVDADGSQSMTVPASSYTLVTKIAVDNWMAECFVAAGTRTIPTPA